MESILEFLAVLLALLVVALCDLVDLLTLRGVKRIFGYMVGTVCVTAYFLRIGAWNGMQYVHRHGPEAFVDGLPWLFICGIFHGIASLVVVAGIGLQRLGLMEANSLREEAENGEPLLRLWVADQVGAWMRPAERVIG